MNYDETTQTSVDPGRAWSALSAVTTYPRWTSSMTTVTPLDGTDLAIGHRFRIKQPGLPAVVWQVTELSEGESFTWEAHSPGVHSVAFHRVHPTAGGTQIVIGLRQTGSLAGLLKMLTETKTRRFLRLEAAGLKAAAEATSA
jgi:hypothetical protein